MQDSGAELAQRLRTARNARSFAPQPVPQEALAAILEIARWTGSAGHKQPWQFIVIDDKETLRALAASGDNLAWLAGAPLAIVLVMDGAAPTESFDEGRLAERIFAGAHALGLGSRRYRGKRSRGGFRRERYRDRHPGREAEDHLRGVSAGRRHDESRVWRHGARPFHQP